MTFPLKKNGGICRVRGACPCSSGSQVWADNCRVCAAETDDYRVYCLSQAQSTLIQQSHLSLIYDSSSLSLSSLGPYTIPLAYAGSKLTLMSLLAECAFLSFNVRTLQLGGRHNNNYNNHGLRSLLNCFYDKNMAALQQ